MTMRLVHDPRHSCQLPRYIDQFDHKSGEIYECTDCGRYWRLWLSRSLFDWDRVGWWESRKIRRANANREEPQP